MTYHDQWKVLSSRIRGLMQAGQLHARFLTVRTSDTYGRGKRLGEHVEGVLTALRSFRYCFQHSLPPAALASIDDFVAKTGGLIGDTTGPPDIRNARVWAALVLGPACRL